MMEYLELWWVQALVIAGGAAAFLNGAPFLPYLDRIKPKKMEARLVGFIGTSLAYGLWCNLNPDLPARIVYPVWVGICGLTLGVNWVIHMIRRDNPPASGDKVIRIGLTEKGQILLEEILKQKAPGERGIDGLFKREQMRETAQERWEDVMFPANGLPGLIDEIMACIMKALKEEQPIWLLPALADAQEARHEICKIRWNSLLWYRLFWPEHAG